MPPSEVCQLIHRPRVVITMTFQVLLPYQVTPCLLSLVNIVKMRTEAKFLVLQVYLLEQSQLILDPLLMLAFLKVSAVTLISFACYCEVKTLTGNCKKVLNLCHLSDILQCSRICGFQPLIACVQVNLSFF